MKTGFGDYLEGATQKILEIVDSPYIGEEERNDIIQTFSNDLLINFGNTDELKDYEPLLYGVSVKYIDKKITEILSKKDATLDEYLNAVYMCKRQQEIFGIFQSNNWELPEVNNTNLIKCEESLRRSADSITLSDKILAEDRKIRKLSKAAQKELSVSTCDSVMNIISELEKDITLCKSKNIRPPEIDTNIRKSKKKIAEIRVIALQKEALHNEIQSVDYRISELDSIYDSKPQQWEELIELSQKEIILLDECDKRQWPLPELLCNPFEIEEKYNHYFNMIELDRKILSGKDTLTRNEQYKRFFDYCDKQRINIEICNNNKWDIPALYIENPVELKNSVNKRKIKNDKTKIIKRKIAAGAIAVICLFIAVLFGIHKYKEGKIQIPFDYSYVNGKSVDEIYDELEKAGFENIKKEKVYSGWKKSGDVVRVSIDNKNKFKKGRYRKPDVEVIIFYSSEDRIDLTDVFKDWQTKKYGQIKKSLKEKGFTKITISKKSKSNRAKNQLVSNIKIEDEEFTSGDCYLPKTSSIEIKYYMSKAAIGDTADSLEGEQYATVVKKLKKKGFMNIELQRANNLISGWLTKEGSIKEFSINGDTDFSAFKKYFCDDKIVIIVNTFKEGCDDITIIAD